MEGLTYFPEDCYTLISNNFFKLGQLNILNQNSRHKKRHSLCDINILINLNLRDKTSHLDQDLRAGALTN